MSGRIEGKGVCQGIQMLSHFLLSLCAQGETEMSKEEIQDGDKSSTMIEDNMDPHTEVDEFSG